MKTVILALSLSAVLSGCAASGAPVVEIKGDSYCDIAKKITWSQADTAATVRQVVRENAKVDRVCGVKTTS